MKLPSSCVVCGRPVRAGETHCPLHAAGDAYHTSCRVCGAPTAGSAYCPAHTLTEEERLNRHPYRGAYHTSEYRHNRRLRYERAHGRCEVCGGSVPLEECEIHHVVPLSRGGSNELDNLIVTHHACHPGRTKQGRR